MLTRISSHIIDNPWIYDLVQLLAGVNYVHRRLLKHIPQIGYIGFIVDMGGGTGIIRHLWPPSWEYICLDIDVLKLRGFLSKYPHGIALLANASQAPVRSGSVDIVLCTFIAHHIQDDTLTQLIKESMRVLKNTGKFIFIDQVWVPTRWAGRLLWKFDRGKYFRTAEALHSFLSPHCKIIHWERFTVYHEYVLCVGEK